MPVFPDLQSIREASVMNAHPLVVSPWITARDEGHVAREFQVDHLLVGSAQALHGLVCLCDLFEAPDDSPIDVAMTPSPVTIEPGAPLGRCARTAAATTMWPPTHLPNVGCCHTCMSRAHGYIDYETSVAATDTHEQRTTV